MSEDISSPVVEHHVLSQTRTCRYGHGALTEIDRLQGRGIFVALACGNTDATIAAPKWIGPLQWHLCKVCGYMEIVDPTPSATISNMAGADHG